MPVRCRLLPVIVQIHLRTPGAPLTEVMSVSPSAFLDIANYLATRLVRPIGLLH